MHPRFRPINITQVEKYFTIEEDGAVWSKRKHKYVKPTFNTAGYLYVNLPVPDETDPYNPEFARMYGVHRLVATKYIGPCPDNMETTHNDGNKMNNHYTNLQYKTHSQNILQSYREHGRVFPSYPRKPFSDATKALMSDLKKKRVRYIHDNTETTYQSIEDAAKALNTYRRKIYRCIYTNTPFKDKKNLSIGGYLSFVD